MGRETIVLAFVVVVIVFVGGYFYLEHYLRLDAIRGLVQISATNRISDVSGDGLRERFDMLLLSGDYWIRFKSSETPVLKEPGATAASPPLEALKRRFPSDANSLFEGPYVTSLMRVYSRSALEVTLIRNSPTHTTTCV